MDHQEKTASLVSKVQAQSAAALAFHELYASTRANKFEAKKAEKERQPPRLIHMGNKNYQCSSYGCKLAFSNMQQLLQHTRVHNKPIQSLEGRKFHCSNMGCKEVLPSMQELLAHQKTHYKPNRYFKCENCMLRCRSHRSLFKHLHVCYDVSIRPSPQRAEKKKQSPSIKGGLEASVKPLLLEGLPKLQSVIIHPEKETMVPKVQSVIIHPEKEALLPKLQSVIIHPEKEAMLPKLQSVIVHPEKEARLCDTDTATTETSTSAAPLQLVGSLEGDLPDLPPDLQDDLHPGLQDDLPPDLQDDLQDSLSSLPVTSPVPQTFSLLETSLFGSSPLPRLSGEVHTATSEPFLPYVQPTPYSFSQANVQHRLKPYLTNQGLPGSNAVWKKNQGHSANSRIVWEHTRGRYSCMQCQFATASRDEMTQHVEDHNKDPPSRLQSEMDYGAPTLTPFHSKRTSDLEKPIYSQL